MQNIIVTRQHMEENILPVRHLSYSAIRSFLQSENLFIKKYIRREFDEIEKPVFLIGKAVHSALEKYHGGRAGMFEEFPTTVDEVKKVAREAFDRMAEEARQKVMDRYGIQKTSTTETTVTSGIEYMYFDKDGLVVEESFIEERAIEWSKTITQEKAIEQMETAVVNYLSDPESNKWIPRSVEISETVLFSDFDGDVMPVPLKGILDLIAVDPEGKDGIVDYKIVTSFTDPEEWSPSYEIQAAVLYFVYQGIRGKAPDFAVFEEVKKSESGYVLASDPARKLLQADLRELCETHGLGWEKFEKNDQLKDKLAFAKVLIKEPSVNRIVYKFEERKDILRNFLEIYRRVVNRLGISALFSVPYEELPNPFDMMSGKDSWKDFVEVLDMGIDPHEAPPVREWEDESALDDYDF